MDKFDWLKPLFEGNSKSSLWIRQAIGIIANLNYLNIDGCGHCGCNFFVALAHTTPYGEDGDPSFSLCEACWRSLMPEKRLPYYRDVYGWWIIHEDKNKNGTPWKQKWEEIETAVLAGL